MILSPANIAFFLTTLDQTWWSANKVTEPWNAKVARPYNVKGEQWVEAWIEMLPKYREWLGPRFTNNVKPRTFLVPVKNWELTVEIDKYRLEDSTAAQAQSYYAPTAQFMGMQAKKLWDYQLRDLIEASGAYAGSSAWQLGPDALTFWSTAHPVDLYDSTKGTYSNDYRGNTGTASSPGGPFTTNGFNTAWEDMALRKNESGEKFGIQPNLSMFPIQLKAAAMTILQSQFYGPPQMGTLGSGSNANAAFVGAMDNPLRGWTDLMINPDLTSATQWYMLLTNGPVKPFSILLRQAPNMVPRTSPQDPVVFNEHKYLWGSDARGTPSWGLPWTGSISG